jgi:hypothetical protein
VERVKPPEFVYTMPGYIGPQLRFGSLLEVRKWAPLDGSDHRAALHRAATDWFTRAPIRPAFSAAIQSGAVPIFTVRSATWR